MRVVAPSVMAMIMLLVATTGFTAPPAPLKRTLAKKILLSAGYDTAAVAVIVHGGVGQLAGESVALVVGVGWMEGRSEKIEEPFYYDMDLGWVMLRQLYDQTEKENVVQVWASGRYRKFAAKDPRERWVCINNMRQMESGKEQWAMANNQSDGVKIRVSDVVAYIKGGRTPKCPSGGRYIWNVVGTDCTCSVKDHFLPPAQ